MSFSLQNKKRKSKRVKCTWLQLISEVLSYTCPFDQKVSITLEQLKFTNV